MELYERLIRIIDAYVATFGGATRMHGVQTLLIVQKATRFGNGVSPSTLHRLTGAPLENIRRRFQQFTERGLITAHPDPKDDRSTLYTMTNRGLSAWPAGDVARKLYTLRQTSGRPESPPRLQCPETLSALLAVLQAFADALDAGIRIRGYKTALLIQQATLSGEGITASTLSRETNAALETVRRHMAKHETLGDLKLVENPDDERATLVLTANPDREHRAWTAVARRLDALDWHLFNVT
ncbi:MAG: hypothetical protein AB7I04_16620 [Pseudomonadales bacterium]